MAIGVSAIMVVAILLFARIIAGSFTETREVVELSRRMLYILAPGHLVFALAMVLWGTIRGAGDAMSPLWAALINTIFIRVPAAYLLVYWLGAPEAIMYALIAAWTVNMLLAVTVYRIGKWRKMGIVKRVAKLSDE